MKTITKGVTMNNFKKVGLSALAGSLAMVSAHAVEVSIAGSAAVTYATGQEDTSAATTDGLSSDTGLDITASGELDNGWTVSTSVAAGNTLAATSNQLSVTMGSLGSLQFNQIAGSKVRGLDDKLPTAYEEVWDGSQMVVGSSIVGDATNDGSISYSLPALEMSGATMELHVDYDPAAEVADAGTGARAVNATGVGSGLAYGGSLAFGGLTLYGAYEEVEYTGAAVTDEKNSSVNVVYAMGPISIGYLSAYSDRSNGDSNGQDYEGQAYSAAFKVNDDFSVSYATWDDEARAITATTAVTSQIDAYAVAYTMGSMAIKLQHTKTDNADHTLNKDASNTELAVTFSF
jgi:outer membrane protein OmpU